ncbi:acetylornithine deacetylase [Limobrevibacterium gyesilva]|uniref:Acetylornithine deacetylase n=1 Tax=Limobrevibacterium gyesilva TaxID=2991712 RepID=A0AA41YSY2_9PROT|nr:acetylornithine deacetylase [Limobrevibacterium gyesilva]MCW3475915.1 acetylornithine deacetylase [Limobrevibacterium gyesilva]
MPRTRFSTAEMLERLVGFDTTSRNTNLALIDFIRAYLDGWGVPYRVSTDPTGRKANLHAIVGPHMPGGIALSGHVDTVPVDGQAWSSDPFALRRADGKLYGRGAADMKGFIASCLAAVPDLQARGLARPAHLFITYDEETDMGGARRLIGDLEDSSLRPAMCIVGEPSLMQPILAHKGRLALRVTAHGKAGHSSEPGRGVNAVHAVAAAIGYVAAEQRRFAAEGPFAEGFDPPHTTPHVGTVEGGTILNIIPERASFVMEWRTIPQDDFFAEMERLRRYAATQIEPAMKAVDPACGFEFEVLDWIPGLALAPDHALTTLVKQLTGSNSTGKVSYGTEGGLYEAAGIPTIVCGPGSIAQAHKPDEWIEQTQLDACDAFLRRLADRLAA